MRNSNIYMGVPGVKKKRWVKGGKEPGRLMRKGLKQNGEKKSDLQRTEG